MKEWILGLFAMDASGVPAPEGWQRIAQVRVERASGRNEIKVEPACDFSLLKLRSLSVDMEVSRWTVEFENGSLQDLSVGWLMKGTECRPMQVAGRRLKGMAVEYAAGARARAGMLDVFAHR
jgi:hypothetical protein